MTSIKEIILEGVRTACKKYEEDTVIVTQQPTDELLEECECDGMTIPVFDAHSPSQEELDEADEWIIGDAHLGVCITSEMTKDEKRVILENARTEARKEK